MTFRRTKRASAAGSITWVVVPAFPVCCRTRLLRTDQRSSAGLPTPLLHVLDRLAFPDAVDQGRLRQAAPRQPFAPDLRLHAVPEEDQRRAGAPARRPTARVWRRRRDAARPWRSSTPAWPERSRRPEPARRRKGHRGPRYSPPIRYWYRASTFSSAGRTPSMRWPSSAIRPSARANCSRSRVITSMPIRSSFSLISVT